MKTKLNLAKTHEDAPGRFGPGLHRGVLCNAIATASETVARAVAALQHRGAVPLANAGGQPGPEHAFLVFAEKVTAPQGAWQIALPNDAGIDDDGWALIAPFGRHPKTRLYRDGGQVKEQKFVQVLDNESADALVSKENSFFGRLKRAVVGIPVYKLHGDMADVDPKALSNTREKIKLGVVDDIRKGPRGIEAHFALDHDGAQAVTDGFKYPSAYWYVLPNGMESLSDGTQAILAKPFKMISVALTPYPNISGVESLANSLAAGPIAASAAKQSADASALASKNKHEPNERKTMKTIAGYLLAKGTGNPVCQALANNTDPSESQILAAVQSILDGRDGSITALGNDKTTLNGTITTLTSERDGHKTRADQNATALANEQTARKAERTAGATAIVDAAIHLGIVAVADRAARITALENSTDFAKDSQALMKTVPVFKTRDSGLDMSGRQQAALSNEAMAFQNEYNAALTTELIAAGQDPVKAHQRIMTLPQYAGLAAKLAPKQKGM